MITLSMYLCILSFFTQLTKAPFVLSWSVHLGVVFSLPSPSCWTPPRMRAPQRPFSKPSRAMPTCVVSWGWWPPAMLSSPPCVRPRCLHTTHSQSSTPRAHLHLVDYNGVSRSLTATGATCRGEHIRRGPISNCKDFETIISVEWGWLGLGCSVGTEISQISRV